MRSAKRFKVQGIRLGRSLLPSKSSKPRHFSYKFQILNSVVQTSCIQDFHACLH